MIVPSKYGNSSFHSSAIPSLESFILSRGWVGRKEAKRGVESSSRVCAGTVPLVRGQSKVGSEGGGCGPSVANRLGSAQCVLISSYNSGITLHIALRFSSLQQGRVHDPLAHCLV
jgi:hypothetical protein